MAEAPAGEWRVIHEEARPGPVQMALDEIAARTVAEGGPRTVRVYRWEPSTLSLGYGQAPETIDWDYCARAGIDVTRRPTGGGAIYHDARGDISYSIVAPAADLPADLLDSYELLCAPIFDAYQRMGIDARFVADSRPAIHQPACYLRELHPAHDIVAPDGRKLSGNAQYRQRDAVIQHGSLTWSRVVEAHLGVFSADIDPESFRERVSSIHECVGIPRERAVSTITSALADWAGAASGEWEPDELERARALAAEKYEDEAWVRGGTHQAGSAPE